MIIQIRGTSGSGKSTAVRAFMKRHKWKSHYIDGRRQPLYYTCEAIKVAVLGHYESDCGGCDTINGYSKICDLVTSLSRKYRVLFEGLLISEDFKNVAAIPSMKEDGLILFLATPLETCLESIIERRRRKGNDKPLNPENTATRVKRIESARKRLVEAGFKTRRVSRNQLLKIIIDSLEN